MRKVLKEAERQDTVQVQMQSILVRGWGKTQIAGEDEEGSKMGGVYVDKSCEISAE